jgi:putative oxidoreductase
LFASVGPPPALAYVTTAAEVLGGLALILGLGIRIVAVASTPILLGAIVTVHGAAPVRQNSSGARRAYCGWDVYGFTDASDARWVRGGRAAAVSDEVGHA